MFISMDGIRLKLTSMRLVLYSDMIVRHLALLYTRWVWGCDYPTFPTRPTVHPRKNFTSQTSIEMLHNVHGEKVGFEKKV